MKDRSDNAPPESGAAPLKIFIVAGEASGDQHAAPLMEAIRARARRPVVFRGIGGDAMRAAGLEQLVHCDSISVIGLWEVLKRIGFFMGLFRRMKREIAQWRPDLLLTVDYPGFNIRLATAARKAGIPTVHYICPQVWVWRRDRIWKIARAFDGLVTIFPFEPKFFEPTALRPVFAGHPLVDRAAETLSKPEAPLPWAPGCRRVALLPGSRPGEIERLLPVMLAAAAILERRLAGKACFVVPASSPAIRAMIEARIAAAQERPARLEVVDGQAREVLRQAETAAVASGTATLEASLMLCPSILVYRGSWLSYRLAKFVLRRVGRIGLANLITEKRDVMPELLQYDLTPESLSAALANYLENRDAREKAVGELRQVNATLGGGDSAQRAAAAVLDVLGRVQRRDR